MRNYFNIIFLSLLLSLLSVPLHAIEVLDQSFELAYGIRGYVIGWRIPDAGYPWSPMAGQTVTAGNNVNNISKVRTIIWDASDYRGYDGNGYGVSLKVWSDINRTKFLGQSEIKDNMIPGWEAEKCCAFVDFEFSPPVAITPGSQYFLELTTNADVASYNVIVTWPTNYNRGNFWQAWPAANFEGLEVYDIVFKVFSDSAGAIQTLKVHSPVDLGPEQAIPNNVGNAITGQTFTATTDSLKRIDVLGKDSGSGTKGITLHLYKGGPNRDIYLGSAFAADSGISNFWNYISFVFEQEIDLVSDHLYFMEFISGDPHYRLAISSKDGGVVNNYTGGNFWKNGQFWQITSEMSDADWIFETYTIAEPRFCEEMEEYADLDINQDCYTDWGDMLIMAEEWLK